MLSRHMTNTPARSSQEEAQQGRPGIILIFGCLLNAAQVASMPLADDASCFRIISRLPSTARHACEPSIWLVYASRSPSNALSMKPPAQISSTNWVPWLLSLWTFIGLCFYRALARRADLQCARSCRPRAWHMRTWSERLVCPTLFASVAADWCGPEVTS